MTFVSAVDLGSDGELVAASCVHIKIDCPSVLKPGIRIDPQVSLVPGKVPSQKWARHLRLERLRRLRPAGKFEVPSRPHDVFDSRVQPVTLFLVEPEVEDPERDVPALRQDRRHRIAQQRKIIAIRAAGDQQWSRPHSRSTKA